MHSVTQRPLLWPQLFAAIDVDLGPWHVSRVGGQPTARLLLLRLITVLAAHIPIHCTDKAPDVARSVINIQQDGASSAICMGHSSRNRAYTLKLDKW